MAQGTVQTTGASEDGGIMASGLHGETGYNGGLGQRPQSGVGETEPLKLTAFRSQISN